MHFSLEIFSSHRCKYLKRAIRFISSFFQLLFLLLPRLLRQSVFLIFVLIRFNKFLLLYTLIYLNLLLYFYFILLLLYTYINFDWQKKVILFSYDNHLTFNSHVSREEIKLKCNLFSLKKGRSFLLLFITYNPFNPTIIQK